MKITGVMAPSFKAVIASDRLVEELTAMSKDEEANPTLRNRSGAALNAIREATNQQKTNKKVNLFVDYGSMYLGYGDSFENAQPIKSTIRNFKEIFVKDKISPVDFLPDFYRKIRQLSEQALKIGPQRIKTKSKKG